MRHGTIVAACAAILVAGSASAGEPKDATFCMSVGLGTTGAPSIPGTNLAFPNLDLVASLGTELVKGQLGLFADLSLAYDELTLKTTTGAKVENSSVTLMPWDLGLSIRWNFVAAASGALVPSLKLRGFYGQVGTKSESSTAGIDAAPKKTTESTIDQGGVTLIYGMEYLVNDHLGLGGEAGLGWRRATEDDTNNGTKTELTNDLLSYLVNLYVSFRM